MDREQLLATAVAVGLVLGVDFEKNISNVNLQKKIEEKQEELLMALKGSSDNIDRTLPTDKEKEEQLLDGFDNEEERLSVTLKALEDGNLKEVDLSDYDKELLSKYRQGITEAMKVPKELQGNEKEATTTINENQITDKKTVQELEDNALIMRKTECFTYRTEIIGFEETARRSGLTVEEVKEAIETGKPANGYIFEFVG